MISMGVVVQLESVTNVAEKTIEFRNFQNVQVPREVVAGHLTMDLKPKHASSLQKYLTGQMWEQARHGQEVALRPPSEWIQGLDSSSIAHHVSMTVTSSKDPSHHKTSTAHIQTAASGWNWNDASPLLRLAHGVYWRSGAGELLPIRRWRRRRVDALANRMCHGGWFFRSWSLAVRSWCENDSKH